MLTLFVSWLNDNDLKTATRPDMAEDKLITFSELCFSSGGKKTQLFVGFILPVSVFKYSKFISSVRTADSTVLLN